MRVITYKQQIHKICLLNLHGKQVNYLPLRKSKSSKMKSERSDSDTPPRAEQVKYCGRHVKYKSTTFVEHDRQVNYLTYK